jgi:ferric iron reductase protein FhuF
LGKGQPYGIVDAINRITIGEYDCFAGHIVGRDHSGPAVRAEALLDDGMRAAIEARFAKRFDSFDVRAVHSIWMKWYLNAFLPPVLLADVILARGVPVVLNEISFIVADDSRVSAVMVDGEGEDTTGSDPFDRFESLIFDHFEPLIEIWSTRTEVTRRVYWSNVGNTFEAMLRRIETVSGVSSRLEQARRLLGTPFWPDGRINPIHDAVYEVADGNEIVRRRRVCCLQYMLPDRRFCKACPIDEARAANSVASC